MNSSLTEPIEEGMRHPKPLLLPIEEETDERKALFKAERHLSS